VGGRHENVGGGLETIGGGLKNIGVETTDAGFQSAAARFQSSASLFRLSNASLLFETAVSLDNDNDWRCRLAAKTKNTAHRSLAVLDLPKRIGDVGCPVIGIDDLLANKRAAGRPQDLADVAALERLRKLKKR